MNIENSLIVTHGGKICFLGTSILSYINLKINNPFAFPCDSLKKGDTVIYFDLKGKGLTRREKALLNQLGADTDKTGWLLNIAVYDNGEIQNIFKSGEKLLVENILVDTFFNGNKLLITYDAESRIFNITVGGQTICAAMGEEGNGVFCFNEKGIKYFEYGDSRRITGLEALLSGCEYQGRTKINDYFDSGLSIDDIFEPEFSEILLKTRSCEGTELSQYRGENFYIQTKCFKMGILKYYQYYIEKKRDILEGMRAGTEYYKRLSEEDYKFSNNTLASGFRMWGQDEALMKIKNLLQKACSTGVTILLTGESGTGKTFMAKEIHQNSKRSTEPFIHVNCAAIPYSLIESELFGHEEGAFTGAKKGGRKGYFEMAQNGTVFLDEITELPLTLQGKLLEVIQNKTFYRVGGGEKININVRLIAATNRNLKELVGNKEFREDLYYRINVFPVELPPLRSRKDALMEIVNDVLPEICERIEVEPLLVSGGAMEKMREYRWPGNIRELENVLAKAAIMCDGKVIMPYDIEFQDEETGKAENFEKVSGSYRQQKEFYERKIILEALKRCGGQRAAAAHYLSIGRTNLFEKMRKYGLMDSEFDVEE